MEIIISARLKNGKRASLIEKKSIMQPLKKRSRLLDSAPPIIKIKAKSKSGFSNLFLVKYLK